MIGGRLDKTDAGRDAQDFDARDRADLRDAYERGRRDERAARKRHPLMMTLTFIAALVGVALLTLAAVHGSFGQAGGVVDQQISTAAEQSGPTVRQAADSASQSLHDAAQSARTHEPG